MDRCTPRVHNAVAMAVRNAVGLAAPTRDGGLELLTEKRSDEEQKAWDDWVGSKADPVKVGA